jgi:hypothetical protein
VREIGFDRQLGLGFEPAPGQLELKRADLPAWKLDRDPVERLASFKADASQPPALRQEADGVLQLYRRRSHNLEHRAGLEARAPATLGLLLVTPKGKR